MLTRLIVQPHKMFEERCNLNVVVGGGTACRDTLSLH